MPIGGQTCDSGKTVEDQCLKIPQLIKLAQGKNLLLQEALRSRFMPCFEQVKSWLADQRIGELQYICSDIGFAFGHERGHRLHNPEFGGGQRLDLGLYSVTLSQLSMG
ncbi:MAG: putative dehydrogenase [Paraglaciecola sp.]